LTATLYVPGLGWNGFPSYEEVVIENEMSPILRAS